MANKTTSKKVQIKQNPRIIGKTLAGGRTALYLEYYLGREQIARLDADGNPMYYTTGKMAGKPMFTIRHDRRKEDLKLRLIPERTREDRIANDETKRLAEAIRRERELALAKDATGRFLNFHRSENIFSFFDSYLESYTKKDYRNILLAINRFKTFLRGYRPSAVTMRPKVEVDRINEEWEERHRGINGRHDLNENAYYRFTLSPGQLTPKMVEAFRDFLIANSRGTGASTALKRFKKVIKAAVEEGLLLENPCANVSCSDETDLTKDVLSAEEIARLVHTHYHGENDEIRRAFILTLYTGVRFCDVKELTFDKVDYSNSVLSFVQSKTAGHSSASRVHIPLRSDLLALIGTPEGRGKRKTDRIFDLPSHTMCLKALRVWTAKAGIDKHITWHCGRHSFATNILTNGANVVTTAKLLGHANLKTVEVYVRALDKEKVKAVNSLPALDI